MVVCCLFIVGYTLKIIFGGCVYRFVSSAYCSLLCLYRSIKPLQLLLAAFVVFLFLVLVFLSSCKRMRFLSALPVYCSCCWSFLFLRVLILVASCCLFFLWLLPCVCVYACACVVWLSPVVRFLLYPLSFFFCPFSLILQTFSPLLV